MNLSDSVSHPAEFGRIWRSFDRFRGAVDASTWPVMVLILIFVRAQDEAAWEAVRSSPAPNANELLRKLPSEISGQTGTALGILRDMSVSALAGMIDAVESVARPLGNKAAFSYLLSEFAEYEGKRAGEFYTPKSVAAILVNSLDMNSTSTVYDPFCRSGELLVAAAARASAGSASADFSVHGATPNSESLGIARMHIQLIGIRGELEKCHVIDLVDGPLDTRKFSRILTNPPFNLNNWTSQDSAYWRYGPPPKGNANFAWLQYAVEKLEPGGQAAVVMANGALSSASPRERDIRMRMVEDGCVEALITLPPALFYNTGIPVTIWLLNPPKTSRNEVLFVDASDSGHMVGRTHRDLSDAEIGEIIRTVASWRAGRLNKSNIGAVSIPMTQIREQDYNLNPLVYFSRTPAIAEYKSAMSEIRLLTRRLESEQNEAAEKDAVASRLLRGLT
ncbi:MAG TPA: N-6 DNA methylase [Streptosporangiaceae bacterium]|nr:N-6 DNA methylase [Streptosporangiaceae bacterium]